jgi:hypothetical protein
MENLTAVCVLGMHRSGTSLVAGVTKLVGVYFGPAEHLMKPNLYNTKGYQEHQSFVKINETILSRFGGKWYDPPKLPPGWENAPQLDDLKQQARAMIDQEFAQAELWGWKDPRTCLTLALWQQLVPGILYLICLRHPMSVVRSLEHRDHLSLTRSVYLWLFYLNSALAQIAGHQRTVIFL